MRSLYGFTTLLVWVFIFSSFLWLHSLDLKSIGDTRILFIFKETGIESTCYNPGIGETFWTKKEREKEDHVLPLHNLREYDELKRFYYLQAANSWIHPGILFCPSDRTLKSFVGLTTREAFGASRLRGEIYATNTTRVGATTLPTHGRLR